MTRSNYASQSGRRVPHFQHAVNWPSSCSPHLGPALSSLTRGGVIWCYNRFWLTRRQIMDQVGIFEAKARLSELVDKAERGRETTITRNGKVVARLVPAAKTRGREPKPAAIAETAT